jgi:hypothetical protein
VLVPSRYVSSDSQSVCSTLVCWKVVGLGNALVWEQSLPPDWLEEHAAGWHGRDGGALCWLGNGSQPDHEIHETCKLCAKEEFHFT